MDRREELRDRYEDALFALLMDEMAVDEGKKAREENERLRDDPAAEIPEEVDRRCRRTIRHRFAQKRLHAAGRVTGKVLRNVAMALGVASCLFVGAFAASETVRSNVLNLVVEAFPEYTSFYFPKELQNSSDQLTVGWIPEGFELVDQGKNDFEMWAVYQGNGNAFLQVTHFLGAGARLNIDTEEVVSSDVLEINGYKANFYQKGDIIQIIWGTDDGMVFLSIDGEGISREDMIRIAECIEYDK